MSGYKKRKEIKREIVCGNCGEPMYSHEAYCPKCSYPVDAEEQRLWLLREEQELREFYGSDAKPEISRL